MLGIVSKNIENGKKLVIPETISPCLVEVWLNDWIK